MTADLAIRSAPSPRAVRFHVRRSPGGPGNPESRERLDAYRAALVRHGIPWDPGLVGVGNFERSDGYRATREFLARGDDFDAVVAACDYTALGALRALRESSVVRSLPVTGFDDLKLARLVSPTLTTVAQPFTELARQALHLVLDQAEGRPVPLRTELGTRFLIRESCGCRGGLPSAGPPWAAIAKNEPQLASLELGRRILESHLAGLAPGSAEIIARLARSLGEESSGIDGALVRALEDIASSLAGDDELAIALHSALGELSILWRERFGATTDRLWVRARQVLVRCQLTAQIELRQQNQIDSAYFISASERLSAAHDRDTIRLTMLDTLRASGVTEACMSTFTDADRACLEPIVGVTAGHDPPSLGTPFPSHRVFPSWFASTLGRRTTLVFPLAVERVCYGVSVFVYPSSGIAPQILTGQVASALKNVALHEAVIQQTILRERSVQEKTATAKRLEALAHLAGSVAHDLNNALGPVVGLPDIILEELECLSGDAETRERLRADISGIRDAASRAVETIKDLLTLGRRGRAQMAELDLNRVVAEILAREAAGDLGKVKLATELHPSPLRMQGAKAQLGRAIGNLLRNAPSASRVQGEVVVRTDLVEIHQPAAGYEVIEPGRYAVFEVTDGGDGIAPYQLGRIFEPYFSLKRATDAAGSGLGLAIVHAVVKEHNGFVDVRSEPGRGTTIALYFPVQSERRDRESVPPHGAPRGRRILVVDDEVIQLRTAERVLAHLGHEVHTLQSGSEAYQRLKASIASAPAALASSQYEVILLDVTLNEEHDGIDWLERIQSLIPGQNCILMSGHAAPERAKLALQKGVPWLVKPYTAEAMARVLAEAFSKKNTSRRLTE